MNKAQLNLHIYCHEFLYRNILREHPE